MYVKCCVQLWKILLHDVIRHPLDTSWNILVCKEHFLSLARQFSATTDSWHTQTADTKPQDLPQSDGSGRKPHPNQRLVSWSPTAIAPKPAWIPYRHPGQEWKCWPLFVPFRGFHTIFGTVLTWFLPECQCCSSGHSRCSVNTSLDSSVFVVWLFLLECMMLICVLR